jgi:hypothetical protein
VSGALVWAGVEAVHAVASRRVLGGRGEPDVVLVLGCPARRDGSVHPMQRWRTEIAARTSDRALLVFSGYAGTGGPSEAAVMAGYARDVLAVAPHRIRLEESARSTWQNVEFSLSDLTGADRLAIASSPVHALRARRYLVQQRPDLARRLVPAADYRLGERWWWKAMTVGYDVVRSVTIRW